METLPGQRESRISYFRISAKHWLNGGWGEHEGRLSSNLKTNDHLKLALKHALCRKADFIMHVFPDSHPMVK